MLVCAFYIDHRLCFTGPALHTVLHSLVFLLPLAHAAPLISYVITLSQSKWHTGACKTLRCVDQVVFHNQCDEPVLGAVDWKRANWRKLVA